MSALINQPVRVKASGDLRVLAGGNEAFALDLYAWLKSADGNLFFSPYSISACLAMTCVGARGATAAQMAQTLHCSTDSNRLALDFAALQEQLNAIEHNKSIQLNVANGLWSQKDHPLLPEFLAIGQKDFQAELEQVDFRTQAEPVRQQINDWVSGKTQGRIPNLLGPGTVDPMTRLILVNAIYFKGHWTRQFNPTNTVNEPFWLAPNQKVQARLMHLSTDFKYAELDQLQLLELPYATGDLSMVVLLPKKSDGLGAVESLLNQTSLESWLSQLRSQKVDVFLPKFKLTAQLILARTLVEMGMKDAFSASADFSGIDGARDLFISEVVHQAFVDVSEEGTEAAAATGTVLRMLSVRPRPQPVPVFRADHPFVFLIRDTHTGSILFLGRLLKPS